MTSVLASFQLGVMVADSGITDGDRVWSGKKIWRHKGALIGIAGDYLEAEQFVAWWVSGFKGEPPPFGHSEALVLDCMGLSHFLGKLTPAHIPRGMEAIGSGAKAAMAAFEAMNFTNPKRAVEIACNHDNGSRKPVRLYRL